jgi:asparagine synthase (glutamine-hydrolysing)
MCGIAGILNIAANRPAPDLSLLGSMIGAIRHRGPDEFGCYRDRYVGLAHARLSIIDLLTGSQPMCNETGTLQIVYNGEIFNYVELREELLKCGHRFATASDTEVIIHAWEEWGRECFARFNGQWALALWDTRTRRLILSRDRFGVRPLYVEHSGGRLRFGSEIKALFADPEVVRRINVHGLDQVFTYWAPVAPVTMFEGVEQLRPGTVRVYGVDGTRDEWAFWAPDFPDADEIRVKLSPNDAAAILREKLQAAVRLRLLRADVPVGCYLSGGLDSSLTAALAHALAPGGLKTFSIRFEGAQFDEGGHQQLMARALGTEHHEVTARRADVAAVFPTVVSHTECPVLRTAPAPMFLLSRLVHEVGIKAVLTGEGADELLGGYDLFREAKIREFWARQPESTVRPRLFDRIYPWLARSTRAAQGMSHAFWKQGLEHAGTPGFSHGPRWRTTSALKRLFSSGVKDALGWNSDGSPRAAGPVEPDFPLPTGFQRWDQLSQAQFLEMTTLFAGYLLSSQGDRMLMANSVEGRFPYLDADVTIYVQTLPPSYLLMGLDEKAVLKRAAEGLLPREILLRKKQPYRAPDAACFLVPGSPAYVDEILSEAALQDSGLFDVAAVRALYRKSSERLAAGGLADLGNSDNMGLVGVLSTQLLHGCMVARPSVSTWTVSAPRWNSVIDRCQVAEPI